MKALLASSNGLKLHDTQDALDVLSSGLPGVIFEPSDLHPDYFALHNGIAGETFQKFINYNFRVAFVLPEQHGYGDRITELMHDHKTHPYIRFFSSVAQAEGWLS